MDLDFAANLYKDTDSRYDTVGSFKSYDVEVWMAISKAQKEYNSTVGFREWLLETWGVRLVPADDGYNLNPVFKIESPEKFTMFLLKYKK